MIWLDLLAVFIIIGAALGESTRQFGIALFDMLAVLAAMYLAKLIGPALAGAVTLLAVPAHNQALAKALVFVIVGAVLLVLAKLGSDVAPITLDTFDSVAGGLAGLVSGMVAAHMVLLIILTANPASTPWGEAARKRPAVRQLIYFEGYRDALHWLRHTGEMSPRR
jgi:uncharacterized membrane protein required for colicin V production